jgi:hypothetical protein
VSLLSQHDSCCHGGHSGAIIASWLGWACTLSGYGPGAQVAAHQLHGRHNQSQRKENQAHADKGNVKALKHDIQMQDALLSAEVCPK